MWLYHGITILGKIIQRAGRKGYYLQVAVPRDLRLFYKTSTLVRKLSNQINESILLKDNLEKEIKEDFLKKRKEINKSKNTKNKSSDKLKSTFNYFFKHDFFKPEQILKEKALVLSFWHCIGHSVDLIKEDQYLIIKFFETEVIIHNYKGRLWAFENCCPHRGTKFFKKNSDKSKISCPYHGWTFTPYSSFIPRKDTFPELNKIEDVRPKIWKLKILSGFIFISYKPFYELEEQLESEVQDVLKKIGNSIFKNHSTQHIRFNSNWKVAIENSLEPYHVSFIHKDSLATLGIDDGDNKLYKWASILKHEISSKRVKSSNKLVKKMIYTDFDFDGYWSLYLFPFAMISSTASVTFAHQFYQPREKSDSTDCITKLWCLKSKNKNFENALNNFYDSVSKTNLIIFKEDAEICSYVPTSSWNKKSLMYKSTLEIKVDHFRKCLENFEFLINQKYSMNN